MYFMPHLFSRVLATFTDIDLVLSIYGRTNFEKKTLSHKGFNEENRLYVEIRYTYIFPNIEIHAILSLKEKY